MRAVSGLPSRMSGSESLSLSTKTVRPKAILFDLLTALIDSRTLCDSVARSAQEGRRWRAAYLKITYDRIGVPVPPDASPPLMRHGNLRPLKDLTAVEPGISGGALGSRRLTCFSWASSGSAATIIALFFSIRM